MRHTLSVRRTIYRGVAGWSLSGTPAGTTYRLSIFFEHESAARRTFRHFADDPTYVTSPKDFEP